MWTLVVKVVPQNVNILVSSDGVLGAQLIATVRTSTVLGGRGALEPCAIIGQITLGRLNHFGAIFVLQDGWQVSRLNIKVSALFP